MPNTGSLILRSYLSGPGLDEILTIMRLRLSEHLEPVLSSNDLIENHFSAG
jgi:hypothetical protein